MTTTTPESRGRIAYVVHRRMLSYTAANGSQLPAFDELTEIERQAWIAAANTIWDLATTGHAQI